MNEKESRKSKDLSHNWSNISSLVHLLKELCQITWSNVQGLQVDDNNNEKEERRNDNEGMDVMDEIPNRKSQVYGQLYNFYSIIFTQLKVSRKRERERETERERNIFN